MKSRLLVISLLAFVTALLAFNVQHSVAPHTSRTVKLKSTAKPLLLRCSPDWNELSGWLDEVDIPLITGAGSHKWKINTKSDSAQMYFNQGINMYYSFHIIEAMASFKKAARFDPASPMLYWAQALAYGPNINDLGYAASPDALEAIMKAVKFSPKASAKEKSLIIAQSSRYSADSTVSREKLNQDYADQMKKMYKTFSSDPDVAALYADALMLQHPWDLWNNDGTPKVWTPIIRNVLEKLLIKSPNHPGANHYYIHVMEPSPFAAKALPSADRLGKLTPGLSHTVHMPSHIYLRTGMYSKGLLVNENAINSYQTIKNRFEPVSGNVFLYVIHNLHMKTNNAMFAGWGTYSINAARETANSIPTEYLDFPGALGNAIQYIYMTPVFSDVRFGNWNRLLTYPQPGHNQIYANVIYRFGRGMAFVNQNRFAEATNELTELEQLMKDSVLTIPFTPFSPAIDGAIIAQNILKGTLALKQMKFDDAINYFSKAVQKEDNLIYNEPRDWLLNAKHFLGNALIKAGKPKEAINILQKDLLVNSENGWALYGIAQALQLLNKPMEAEKMMSRYEKAFEKADVRLNGPVL